jgi:mono/diheme cytochrome c family protein
MTKRAAISAVLAAMLALAGCEQAPVTGAGFYGEYCASCHGADARGGPDIDPPAPDLTVLAKNHGGRYPAVYVMSTIDGYARDATHGPMPIFGDLLDGRVETWVDPDGTPTPTPVSLMLLNEYLEGQQEG